jgi:signal-transduction protein with cAMP-binding, CBS, and nucleotidyltransferase domain/PAS domain-containing protein
LIDTFSKKIVKEGRYEINLKKKNGSFIEVLATSSTSLLFDKAVNIIILKDITIDKIPNLSSLDIQKLANTLNIGFFRVSLNHKGRFILANETAKRIFGFESTSDLLEANLIEMYANLNDRKNLKDILQLNGFLKNKILKIHKRTGESAVVSVTLVLLNNEDTDNLICDGTIEDITLQVNKKEENDKLISGLKSNNFLIERPVKEFVTSLITLDSESVINDAIQLLSKRKTDCLLLAKKEKEYIGIITGSDIQKRVLSLDLKLDNPAYLVMSSPVIYINECESINDALRICEECKINHLVVKNESGEVTGILRINDIYRMLKDSLLFYISVINKAETIDDLKQLYTRLQLFIIPLIKSELSVKHITNITSSFSDAVHKKIIELIIKEIGEPPVSFSFVCLGSEGRKEETLFTDQDNAIIYEDVESSQESLVKCYFNKLGEKVCNSLNFIGYSFCKGNIMAKNPRYCQPFSVWEKYFANWIVSPEPQNLLDATIFFDFRNVYGKDEFTEKLRCTISELIKHNPLFLYQMAFNTYEVKPAQFYSGKIISDKNSEIIDLKNAVSPIIMFARTYSLQNDIWCLNTIDRLNALKTNNIVNETSIDEIIYVYNFLMKLRFRNQIELSENNLPLSNILSAKNLIDIELSLLKKMLALIPQYQNKISVDFRLAT